MTKRTRRNHSGSFKVKVALAAAQHAGFSELDMAEVHQLPAAAPDQADRFGMLAVKAIAFHRPGILFGNHQLAVT